MLKFLVIFNHNTFSVEGVSFAELRELLPLLRTWLESSGSINLSAQITSFREAVMAKFEDVSGTLDAINGATNQLAADVDTVVENEAKQLAEIEELKRQLAEGRPVTQEQLDGLASRALATRDRLQPAADKLRGIAANPENPVPEE